MGCHALLQGISLTQGANPQLVCLLHWQAGSLSLVPLASPSNWQLSFLSPNFHPNRSLSSLSCQSCRNHQSQINQPPIRCEQFMNYEDLIQVHSFPTTAEMSYRKFSGFQFSSVQSLRRVWLFATPWITARQASLSITTSWSSPKLMCIDSVMPSSHLTLCRPLLLLPPIPPSIRVFSNESTLAWGGQSIKKKNKNMNFTLREPEVRSSPEL